MDGLLGERLGAGIDGDAHLPTRFVENSHITEKSQIKTPNLSINNPDYISEALKQQLRAQDRWRRNFQSRHLSNDLRELLDSTNAAIPATAKAPLPRLQEVFDPTPLNDEMIVATSLARQRLAAEPPMKRFKSRRRSTADPLSLQRRKTRHAFTERDRTRKLAARIVEMGNILTAAGRFCKQEKLPILTAAVKYVYELQDRLKTVAAKKPRLLQTLQKLKGEIANFQDGHTCTSNIIFHEVTDFEMAPCGGGCHSLDFFSAFNAKSFAVAIVNSKDFTLLASNKLFQQMVQKENHVLIGSYLPHVMCEKCEHIDAYLKRCVELLKRPPLVKNSKQDSGEDVQVPILDTSTTTASGSSKTFGFAPDKTSSLLPQESSQLPPEPPTNTNSVPLGDKPEAGVANAKAAPQGVALLANMMDPTKFSDDLANVIVENSELSSGNSSPASPPRQISPNPTSDFKTGSTSAEGKSSRQSDAQVCGQQACDKGRPVLDKTSSKADSATPGSMSEHQPVVERAIPGSAETESTDAQDVPKVNDLAKDSSKDSVANPIPAKASSIPKSDVPLISYGFGMVDSQTDVGEREADKAGGKSCVTLLLRCKEYILASNFLDSSTIQLSFMPANCMRVSNLHHPAEDIVLGDKL